VLLNLSLSHSLRCIYAVRYSVKILDGVRILITISNNVCILKKKIDNVYLDFCPLAK